ncbi:MAG TPA: 4-hydroxy-3-methylbut-2-enyl diphosphate reductase [Elusimicrobiota bacterium]|nr:4-hydroxy-3-methylbut-2-enyl diphosphate reductase [Elusimicrobiota bacterium]
MTTHTPSKIQVDRLILAKLRGFCAGVVRAIDVVEKALEICGKPVYVRHEIIHNRFVVNDLRQKGAVFVEELSAVPEGSWLIFSAHGVSPAVRDEASARKLKVIDATCPLVTKVHLEAIKYAKLGYSIILIGHDDHVETIGTLGEAPEHMVVVGSAEEAELVQLKDPNKVAYLTQTTLSLDDTAEIIAVLKRRFPKLHCPPKDDICYATQNRQNAVKSLIPKVDLLLVLGAPNSSNSIRLREVGQAKGAKSYLIECAKDIRHEWLEGVKTLGLTASASAPEVLVQEVVDYCKKEFGVAEVLEDATVDEDVHFSLPYELEKIIKERGASAR